jgi:hypothetical protein
LSPREDSVVVGEIAIPIPVTAGPDNATAPQTLKGTRPLQKLLKFDKIQSPSGVQITYWMHAKIQHLLQQIPAKEWEHIQGSGKKRMQIRDFMDNSHEVVERLRQLLDGKYIPGWSSRTCSIYVFHSIPL